MYRTFTSIMLGLGLGLLLLNPVSAEDTFSTLKNISAEPLSQAEMESVEGEKWWVDIISCLIDSSCRLHPQPNGNCLFSPRCNNPAPSSSSHPATTNGGTASTAGVAVNYIK